VGKWRPAAVALAIALVVGASACGGSSGKAASSSSSTGTTTTATTASTASGASAAPEERLVDVGGHALHVVCQGTGAPTVLIELGAGQSTVAWNGTQPELAATHRTCVYERAGSGTSPIGPMPRTAKQVSDELQALVTNANIPTPMIIVSHSIGALYTQLFAAEHEDEVAALVFVDPRTAEYQLGYRANLTPAELDADAAEVAGLSREPFGPEVLAADESAQQVIAAGNLPDVPVVVLTAGLPDPARPQADLAFWRLTHQHLAAQVSRGTERVVEGAEHEIWRTHSSALVDAVTEVAAQI
jgi:pimeloyl-ACP methyl ester carboxylesterase